MITRWKLPVVGSRLGVAVGLMLGALLGARVGALEGSFVLGVGITLGASVGRMLGVLVGHAVSLPLEVQVGEGVGAVTRHCRIKELNMDVW